MISVNLLPWRKMKRDQRRKNFKWISAAILVCMVFYFLFPRQKSIVPIHHAQAIKPSLPRAFHKERANAVLSPIFSDEPLLSENFLQHTYLHDLSWAGVLIKQNQIYAFITSPNGKIKMAKSGDEVGVEKAKILTISRAHIILRVGNQKIIWTRQTHGFSN